MLLSIGIDWADGHHDAAFMRETGELPEEFRFSHDKQGFDLFHERIGHYAPSADQVLAAIET